MKNNKFFGVNTDDDHKKEKKTHFFGSKGNCPIALFLVLASGQKNIVARYFNLFVHTSQANELQKEVAQSKFLVSELVKDKFNGLEVQKDLILPDKLTPWKPPAFDSNHFARMQEKSKHPTEIENAEMMNLNMYANQFAKYLTMLTADYDSNREGTIMTCPMSYIQFWGRKEFSDVYPPIEAALDMLLKEVAKILVVRGFDVDKHNMTVNLPSYPGFTTIEDYGW